MVRSHFSGCMSRLGRSLKRRKRLRRCIELSPRLARRQVRHDRLLHRQVHFGENAFSISDALL